MSGEGFSDHMKYRLFVDDMREIPKGWMGSRTVSDTIKFLYRFSPIDEISLDHDILFPQHGTDRYSMYSSENFSGIAYYIALMPADLRPRKIWIHSANSGAAMEMCKVMGLDFSTTYRLFNVLDYDDNYHFKLEASSTLCYKCGSLLNVTGWCSNMKCDHDPNERSV